MKVAVLKFATEADATAGEELLLELLNRPEASGINFTIQWRKGRAAESRLPPIMVGAPLAEKPVGKAILEKTKRKGSITCMETVLIAEKHGYVGKGAYQLLCYLVKEGRLTREGKGRYALPKKP